MKRLLKNFRPLLLIISIGAFLVPRPAYAFLEVLVGALSAGIIGIATYVINYIIGFLGGIALAIVSWFLDVMIRLNENVLNRDISSVVFVGWEIMRDVANLGFVLVLLVIAFGIMFRLEKYGSQKLLVRLIAAAILVNFSLAIAGPFLQAANVFAKFFLSHIPGFNLGQIHNLGTSLAGAFGSQRFLEPQNFASFDATATTLSTAVLTNIASLLFSTGFVVVAIITVGTLVLLLLIRYLHLVFLLIVAPIVWLFWVVPDLSQQFKDWWKSFINWTFFYPAASFFIYLSFIAVERMKATKHLVFSGGEGFVEATLVGVISQGAQMVVIGGLMIGGLIVAKKFGVESANIGLNLADKAKAGTLAWAGRVGRQAATRPLRGDWGRKVTETMQRTPLLRTAGTFLANQRLKFEKRETEEAKKKLPKDLREQALQYGSLTMTNAGRAQIMENLAKERQKRNKKFESEKKKVEEKDSQIRDLEAQREEARESGNLELSGELSIKIEAARKEKEDLMKSEAYANAEKDLKNIDDAIASLPKTAREALVAAQYDLSKTKLGILYGRTGKAVIPGESLAEKVKKAVKEEEEGEGTGKKGAAPEKKIEKKEEGGSKTT